MKKIFYLTLACFICLMASCNQNKESETAVYEPTGKEVKVVVSMTFKEEYKEELLNASYVMADETRKEKGCIYYDLHQDVNNPLKYVLLECWATQEDLNVHAQTEHMQVYKKVVMENSESTTTSFLKQVY